MLGISKISHTFERYLRPQEISWPAEDILACGRRYLLEKISSTVEDIFDGPWSKISSMVKDISLGRHLSGGEDISGI